MHTPNALELTGLYVYPIKSAAGIRLDAAPVLERGFEHDRRFMLVDREGHQATARQHPKLLAVRTEFAAGGIGVSAPAMPGLRLPLRTEGEARQVRVWADWMPGLAVGAEADGWFSEFLGAHVHLVWMPDWSERRMNPAFGPSRLSFADGNPLHLVNEASVRDLESRAGRTLGVERFRPNLVVRGPPAYAEDGWASVRFGTLELKLHEPCARCMVVNLEPDGTRPGPEPLRSLAAYRRDGKSVLFGQHLHALSEGTLRTGERGVATAKS